MKKLFVIAILTIAAFASCEISNNVDPDPISDPRKKLHEGGPLCTCCLCRPTQLGCDQDDDDIIIGG